MCYEDGIYSDNCVWNLLVFKFDSLCIGFLWNEFLWWSSIYNNGSIGDFKFVCEFDYLLFFE